jgi:hypothetical protein
MNSESWPKSGGSRTPRHVTIEPQKPTVTKKFSRFFSFSITWTGS